MTKKELIKCLEEFPDDMEVVIPSNQALKALQIKNIEKFFVKEIEKPDKETTYLIMGWLKEEDSNLEVILLN